MALPFFHGLPRKVRKGTCEQLHPLSRKASVWNFTASTATIAGDVQAVTASAQVVKALQMLLQTTAVSMWTVTVSMWALQVLCGILKYPCEGCYRYYMACCRHRVGFTDAMWAVTISRGTASEYAWATVTSM